MKNICFDMKEIVEMLIKFTNALDNLSEKDYKAFYIDAEFEGINKNETIYKIADILTNEVVNYKFDENDPIGMHPYIDLPGNLSEEIGISNIVVYPYKGRIHCNWLDSNYMWMSIGDNNILMIDIYDAQNLAPEQIKKYIVQEIFNFKRDAQFVIDGVYDNEMDKMMTIHEMVLSDLNIKETE